MSNRRGTPAGPLFFLTPLIMLILLGGLLWVGIQFGFEKTQSTLAKLLQTVSAL